MQSVGIEIVSAVAEVRDRLKMLREAEELSYRGWETFLRETTGYPAASSTIERQEKGKSGLDGEYAMACMLATGASPAWVWRGEGPRYLSQRAEDFAGAVVDLTAAAERAVGQSRRRTGT